MTQKLYWLSFADGARPTGQQFLGVAIVEAQSFHEAVLASHGHGINPGGEVHGTQVPEGNEHLFPEDHKWRLLTKAEAVALDQRIGRALAAGL